MSQGPEGLKQLALDVIERRDRRGARKYKHENPELSTIAQRQPFLFPLQEAAGERQLRGIRFNLHAGTIYMPSWIHKKSKDTEEEVPFAERPKGEGDLYLRWSLRESIESATRSTIHISADYGPGGMVRRKAEDLLEYLDDLGDRFENGGVTRENVSEVVDEAIAKLEDTGFLNPIKLNKTKVRPQLLKALAPDSKGRFPNKLIIQTMLASIWIKVRHEQISASKVAKKYERWFDMLYEERLRERQDINDVTNSTRELRRQFAGHTQFQSFAPVVLKLRRMTRDRFRADNICVSPYRIPALLFAAGLFGVNGKTLGYEGNESVEVFLSNLIETLDPEEQAKYSDIFIDRPIDQILADVSLSEFERERQITDRINKYLTPLREVYNKGRNWRQRSNGEML